MSGTGLNDGKNENNDANPNSGRAHQHQTRRTALPPHRAGQSVRVRAADVKRRTPRQRRRAGKRCVLRVEQDPLRDPLPRTHTRTRVLLRLLCDGTSTVSPG